MSLLFYWVAGPGGVRVLCLVVLLWGYAGC